MPVNFDRGLAGAQFRPYLLVEQPGNYSRHHCPLSRGEGGKPATQFFNRCQLLARFAIPFQPLLNGIQQILVAEKFG
jgi:hypothetical protein